MRMFMYVCELIIRDVSNPSRRRIQFKFSCNPIHPYIIYTTERERERDFKIRY